MAIEVEPISDGDAIGDYATLADLQAWQGDNVSLYSDIQNTGTLDANRVQAAFDSTDAEIRVQLKSRGLAMVPSDADVLVKLREISIRLAIAWLYGARDSRDEQEQVDASGAIIKARTWRKDALNDLRHLCLYGVGFGRIAIGAVGHPTVVE